MPEVPGVRWIYRLPRRSLRRIRADIDAEIAYHLDRRTEELVTEDGMDPGEARERAEREFGDFEETKRALRERDRRIERRTRRRNWLDDLRKDVVFAVRTLWARPGFTTAAILTLALGIGGTTVMFGALDALFLRPPAGVDAAERVHRLHVVRDEGTVQSDGGPGSYVDFRALREGARGAEELAAFLFLSDYDYGLGVDAQRIRGRAVSAEFFSLLGVVPAIGRVFVANDDADAARPIVVLSHGFWRREFGADPDIVGRTLLLNGESYTVVGVAEREFTGIDAEPVDVWTPLAISAASWIDTPYALLVRFLARRAPGVDIERVTASAEAALAASATEYEGLDPDPGVLASPLNPARGLTTPEGAQLALWVGAATLLVLLIACANVANLLLARARSRRREIALRLAMGASRMRVARQLLTESTVLALMGGGVGLLLAIAGTGLIRQFPVPPAAGQIDGRLLAFVLLASLVTGLLFGLAPAFDAARTGLAGGLKEARPGARPSRGRLRTALVVGQIALSLVLLVGAGLFVRSLRTVVSIDAGVDVERLVRLNVDLSSAGYDGEEAKAFYDRALDRLATLPGVSAATVALPRPLGGGAWASRFDTEYLEPIDEGPYVHIVGTDYFRATGNRIVRGRALTERDGPGAEPVLVVNETLARAIAPDGAAEGMCIPVIDQPEEGGCTRIVGVAEDVRRRYLDADAPPSYFLPRAQVPLARSPLSPPVLIVRTAGDPADVLGTARRAVQGLAPDLPYVDAQRLETLLGPAMRPFRLGTALFTAFGALAMVLAAVGLYGVVANVVVERTHEIGVRKALGAPRARIVRMVVRQGLVPVLIGLVIGSAAVLAGTRVIEALLYGISPRDPLTLAAAAIVLAGVAIFASWLPTRRAVSVDPVIALREG